MAYKITATTDDDADLLDQLRQVAYKITARTGKRMEVSEVIREAFKCRVECYNTTAR